MNFTTLVKIFYEKKCKKIYAKKLSPNDNSKNQVYFGGSFDILNIFPSGEIFTDLEGKRKRESFKSKLNFFWVDNEGETCEASYAQLISYPDYPEVRFSGFLKNCKKAPSELMNSRQEGRILFLGVADSGKIYGFLTSHETEIANEFSKFQNTESHGVFTVFSIYNGKILNNSRVVLLNELKRIHNLGWICSKRLKSVGELLDCNYSNCGGYTLEAELGIPSNSISGPDFMGWEIKQFNVSNFEKFGSKSITLMDHSPTGGYFSENGAEAFIKKYGYPDKKGRVSRINFGGIHKYDTTHKSTSLRLTIIGYDPIAKRLSTNGYVALVDKKNDIAASWSFQSIINHWKAKHPLACYVPSKSRNGSFINCNQQYCYGNKIILGTYTDVILFINQLYIKNIIYDPGIKLELEIKDERKQNIKVRSLFRTKPAILPSLYIQNEVIDVSSI